MKLYVHTNRAMDGTSVEVMSRVCAAAYWGTFN